MQVRRILCPIDFSEPSTHALEQATSLARVYGARLAVLHVRPTVTPHPDLPVEGPVAAWLVAELAELRQRVDAACRESTADGVDVETLTTAGLPAAEILRCAGAPPADLIVMGTHGTSGIQHLVLGSVAEKVLRAASCPVVTVPPRVHAARPHFTRIVCAVDFSDCSLKAATVAAALATKFGATLHLLHVIEWPWHESESPEVAGVPPAQAQAIADYRRYLDTGAQERLDAVAASVLPAGTVATSVRFGRPVRRTARRGAPGAGGPRRARRPRPERSGPRVLRVYYQSRSAERRVSRAHGSRLIDTPRP